MKLLIPYVLFFHVMNHTMESIVEKKPKIEDQTEVPSAQDYETFLVANEIADAVHVIFKQKIPIELEDFRNNDLKQTYQTTQGLLLLDIQKNIRNGACHREFI